MKKLIPFALALTLAFSFIGCGTSGTSAGSTTTVGLIDQQTLNQIELLALQYAIAQMSQSQAMQAIVTSNPAVPTSVISDIVAAKYSEVKSSKPKSTPKPVPAAKPTPTGGKNNGNNTQTRAQPEART